MTRWLYYFNTAIYWKMHKGRTTSQTLSKLKLGRKYYVRIRAYKNARSNCKTMKIFSNWSKAQKVTTQK